MEFPASRADLVAEQRRVAALNPPAWHMIDSPAIAGCFVAFSTVPEPAPEERERAFAAATITVAGRPIEHAMVEGVAGAGYEPGLLALRAGALLADATRALRPRPHVLIVNASGRDHPRRAGLALHLGAVLELPTVGVTHRPLVAPIPEARLAMRGELARLELDDECVGAWLCTANGRRPLAVHAGWRTDPETAVAVVLATTLRYRTPLPLRIARSMARRARSIASGPG